MSISQDELSKIKYDIRQLKKPIINGDAIINGDLRINGGDIKGPNGETRITLDDNLNTTFFKGTAVSGTNADRIASFDPTYDVKEVNVALNTKDDGWLLVVGKSFGAAPSGSFAIYKHTGSNEGTGLLIEKNKNVSMYGDLNIAGNSTIGGDLTIQGNDIKRQGGNSILSFDNQSRVTISKPSYPAGTDDFSGIRFLVANVTEYWDIWYRYSPNRLWFTYQGDVNKGGYLEPTKNDDIGTFTGQHYCDEEEVIDNSHVGLIVVSVGKYSNISYDENITINEALPKIALSNKRNQKSVFGVVSNKEDDGNVREKAFGKWVSCYEKEPDEKKVIVNSLGEGAIWVCNINGNLENGDYITTCEIPGYGMKQDDDLLHNYTVAKITADCNFDLNNGIYECIEFEYNGFTYRKAFIGCTYHCG